MTTVTGSSTANTRSGEFDVRCAKWLAQIAAGEESALEAFYAETLGNVYGIAIRITQNRGIAEEVVIDVYHQVWLQATQYSEERGRPLTWLLSISRSRALDHLRKESRARRIVEALGAHDETYIEDNLVEAIEQKSQVGQMMTTLTAVQRGVLMLAYFRELSQSQIADHMGIPLGTVKSNMRRALLAMRESMAGQVA